MDGLGFCAAAAGGTRTPPLPCSVSSLSMAKAAVRSNCSYSFGCCGVGGKEWKHIRWIRGEDARESVARLCFAGDEGFLREEIDCETKLVRTLLIDNYDSYTYNIYQDLSVINGVPPVVVSNDEWTWDHARRLLLEDHSFDNIVISPGPGSPEHPGDIGICLKVLLECKNIPILGVCLGHQALGYVHGAKIIHAPEPVHGRLSEIEHSGNNLFLGIPSDGTSRFKVVRYHSLIVDMDSLPDQLIPIAWTTSKLAVFLSGNHEASRKSNLCRKPKFGLHFSDCSSVNLDNGRDRQKVLMGIMHSKRPHYGVQFHPESIATSHGKQIFGNFKRLTVNHMIQSKRKVQHTSGMTKDVISVAIDLIKNQPTEKLKLEYKILKGLARKVGGSGNIFLKLFRNREAEDTFWLDSSSTEQNRARFSFMGSKGGPMWKQVTFYLSDNRGGGHLLVRNSSGESKTIFLKNGFLDYIDEELKSYHYDEEDYQLLPFDFCGGFVGYLGYGLKVECGASSNRHKSMTPDACFFFADNLLVIDHENDDVYLLSLRGSSSSSSKWLENTEKRLIELLNSPPNSIKPHQLQIKPSIRENPRFVPAKSKSQYMDDVERCLEFIRDGESYELCLTTQMKTRVGQGFDSLGAYFELRERNPAPYAAWLNFSQENLSILCSSPERFLKLDGNGTLEAKPIKGTVARGSTLEEDYRLKLKLQNSEKDQAENLMIVDLLRNDLGRVCRPGTVRVPHLMKVESYATVHTLVSTVQGKKSQHISPVDCVRAAFPGGSMTGAPKLRSMEVLDSLECCPRGIYSGSIGFFSYNKRFDLNIVIRSVVIHDGEASIGAGGAVVTLSDPKDEYEEMMLKSKAPARVIEDHYHHWKSQQEKTMTTSPSGELCGPSCS